LPDALGKEFLL